jgi:GNAT superfamily N-acetyltransferase
MPTEDSIKIRPYDAATDAAAVRACFIELQDHEHALDPHAPTGEAIADDYIAWIFERCGRYQGRVLIASMDGEVVGFISVLLAVPRTDPDDPVPVHALVQDLVVRARCRNHGVGARMIATAEEQARAAGRPEIRVWVVAQNQGARRFYARAGYDEQLIHLGKALS